jgi:hypothetical protein
MTEQSDGEVRRFIGLVLIIIAVLWMASAGLCAATMIYGMLSDGGATPADQIVGWSFFVLFISGLFAAAGYGVFVVGRGLRR